MPDFDVVIRGGTVATAADVFDADVGIVDGRVAALGARLGSAETEYDAKGKYVLPGGIDSHCHIAQLSGTGLMTADDFETGTRSAMCGGTTTLIPFAAQHKGMSLRDALATAHADAGPKAMIDYALHLIVSDPTPQVLGQELPQIVKEGYTSFKIYMTYDALKLNDREVLEVLALGRREGAVVMVHAENHDVIAYLTDELLSAGKTAPKYHAVAHSWIAEREATHRAISLAEIIDVPILIVHVSGGQAIEQIRSAQARGLKVFAETCPQYLFLTESDLDRDGMEGAKCVCSPPPRDAANQELVWRGLETGVFEIFSSDHAPYRMDTGGKLRNGPKAHFKQIANGVPGLEVRLPLLFSEGVRTGRISLEQFVALTSTNAAKLYGIYPQKGSISVGADADIAIWDPDCEVSISQSMLHDAMDYTPYEGRTVRGWPVMTFSRGDLVWADGNVNATPGRGRFLRRDKSYTIYNRA